MVENIIREIIELDKEAQKITIDIEDKLHNLGQDIEKESRNISETIWENAQQRIDELHRIADMEIAAKTNEIKLRSIEEFQKLNELYEENHVMWENKIFDEIFNAEGF